MYIDLLCNWVENRLRLASRSDAWTKGMIYHLWQAMYHHQHMLFSMTFRLSQYSPHGVNGDAGGGGGAVLVLRK